MTRKENTARIKLIEEEESPIDIRESWRFQPHCHRRNGEPEESYCCAFSSDGLLVAWSKGNGYAEVVFFVTRDTPATSGQPQVSDIRNWYCNIDCSKKILVMEFAPMACDSKENVKYILATGLEGGRIKLWNPLTGDMLYNLSDHQMDVMGLSFTHVDELLLISCSADQTLKVWDLGDDGNMTLTITGHPLPILDCACSPSEPSLICSVGKGRMVFIWKLRGKRKAESCKQLKGHDNDVVSCSWSPDGALLATASRDTRVIIWDPSDGRQIMILGHVNPLPEPIFCGGSNGAWLSCVKFSPDGSKVATLCEDKKLRIWELWSDERAQSFAMENPGFLCRFSPSGRSIALGKTNGSLCVLDVAVSVMPLRHLSRMALRRSIRPCRLQDFPIPPFIRRYIYYSNGRL